MFRDCSAFTSDDDYMTPKSAWEDIAQFLPRDKGDLGVFLGTDDQVHICELGFDVIHENIDFFHNDLGDILVSNPPYSMKKEVVH